MKRIAYLFERFPAFTQTFCYREVRELLRQNAPLSLYALRRPTGEPEQIWDDDVLQRVVYLPEEAELTKEIDRAVRQRELPERAVVAITDWARQTDFLRLYQAAWLGSRLQEDGVEWIHAHFAGMAARTAFWLRKFFDLPFSFTAHANDIFVERPFAIGLDQLVEAASFIVTESDYAARFLQQRHPASAGRVHRVFNGLDLSLFAQSDLSASPPLLLSIGRLIEKKGFPDLLEACRLLKERGQDFRCEIIGEGPLQESLQQQIEHGGLSSEVTLAGPRSQTEIVARLAEATLFVLPCAVEASGGTDNLPTVIMEAMAAGLPVISTQLAGVPEMVEADVTGELVSPNDPSAVAAAIEHLLDDPARARHLGENGLARAKEKFAIEKSARALLALFRAQP